MGILINPVVFHKTDIFLCYYTNDNRYKCLSGGRGNEYG